jgi:hypothetical protein
MCEQKVVGGYIWLRRRIPSGAVLAEGMGAALRWKLAVVEASDGLYVGLVDGDPVLHPVPEALEAGFGIRCVIVSATRHIQFYAEHLRTHMNLFAGVRDGGTKVAALT